MLARSRPPVLTFACADFPALSPSPSSPQRAVRCALHSPTTATAEELGAATADEDGATDGVLSTWEQLHERDWPEEPTADDDGGGAAAGGTVATRGTLLTRALWRFHEPVSFEHFKAWFGRVPGAAKSHPLLAAFLQVRTVFNRV